MIERSEKQRGEGQYRVGREGYVVEYNTCNTRYSQRQLSC